MRFESLPTFLLFFGRFALLKLFFCCKKGRYNKHELQPTLFSISVILCCIMFVNLCISLGVDFANANRNKTELKGTGCQGVGPF